MHFWSSVTKYGQKPGQAKAARILGMTLRQIAYRIQTLNIEVKRF
jgi:transcriptional regulator with GAF, ATPase, and Fis domain